MVNLNFFLIILILKKINCDVYLHNLRGSNNRLNETSATRKNANRLFNSQNNNRGGYNIGVKGSDVKDNEQYNMRYFQSGGLNSNGKSEIMLEWTNQHGCGGSEDRDPHKLNCNIVIQYMCQSEGITVNKLRNGQKTTTQTFTKPGKNENAANYKKRKDAVSDELGLHESFEWYDYCYIRQRNKGLFNADKKLKDDVGATSTRQNSNGEQYGFECPEEKDYWPYFHPNPWKDIVILADDRDRCTHYKQQSHNQHPYHSCVVRNKPYSYTEYNNEFDCKKNNLEWIEFHNFLEKVPSAKTQKDCEKLNNLNIKYVWGYANDFYQTNNLEKECLVQLEQPDCIEAPWTRSNHLGNGREGQPNNYTWTLPYFPSGTNQQCIVRIRYNISTDDYDSFFTDSKYNGENSPIKDDPLVSFTTAKRGLRLAVNTAQFGRTFQDRSHVFNLIKRPIEIDSSKRIHNLNVRGKRGNIVQVYPAVEYDFIPNNLVMKKDDLLHIQWTGSNTHKNGKDGGDGQTGDDGQGRAGTDRNNFIEILNRNHNFPASFESSILLKNSKLIWKSFETKKEPSPADLALYLASSGYFHCFNNTVCLESAENKVELDVQLNDAPASMQGFVLQLMQGTYHYMCSRNNNFSNRSQKGSIIVS